MAKRSQPNNWEEEIDRKSEPGDINSVPEKKERILL